MIKMNPIANGELEYIRTKTHPSELYYQLAEEACEFAQAALKVNRVGNENNPTTIGWSEAYRNLIEEYTDLMIIAENMLGLSPKSEIAEAKTERWYRRLKRVKEVSKDGHNEAHTNVDR